MPTIMLIEGWRFFFYANEMNEPIHIHCQKAEKECKYWIDSEAFEIYEAYSYNMNNHWCPVKLENISCSLLKNNQ